MPKCRKRRICREPDYVIFQSENGLDDVTTLTVDEYEAIRQIDMEGLSQEECAKKMCVARTTAQLIYNSARKKNCRKHCPWKIHPHRGRKLHFM